MAAVVVSVIHITRTEEKVCVLDGKPVPVITAFLFTRGGHEDPVSLRINAGICFNGCNVAGVGFTFDDQEQRASSIDEMKALVQRNPQNGALIFPFLGGEEINNNTPDHAHRRWVIYFDNMSIEAAEHWPDLLSIVRQKVKPERDEANRAAHREKWWQFGDPRPALMQAIKGLNRMLVVSFVSEYLCFAWLSTDRVVSHNVGVFAEESDAFFSVVQSRVHEAFATQLSSGLEDRPGYRPTNGFEPFPFPQDWRGNHILDICGAEYYASRREIMKQYGFGMTSLYNRFHDPNERSTKILDLRRFHDSIDQAVLEAYGWTDLYPKCEFLLEYEDEESEDPPTSTRRKPWRYRWPDDFRDEVLARLLELNKQRAEEERLAGIAANADISKLGNAKRASKARRKKAVDDHPSLTKYKD